MGLRKDIKIKELPGNGMLVINRVNRSHSVSGVGVTRGTVNDPPWLEGAAHLAEHLVCRRSHTYSDRQVSLMLERLFGGSDGPDIKIFTTWTNTFYGHDDLLRKADMREAFLLMASLVHDSIVEVHDTHNSKGQLYELKDLLVERAAVHNETHKYRDDIARLITVTLHEIVYRSNPIRLDGCADINQLRKLTKVGRLKQWMSGNYVPDNLAAIFMGPTQAEALELVSRSGLDQLKRYKPSPRAEDQGDSIPSLSGVVGQPIVRPGINQTHVGLAWPTESFTSADAPAIEVLVRLLKFRTEDLLREGNTNFDAGVYHPGTAWHSTSYHGLLEIWFATVGDGSYVETAEALVVDMCRRLKDDSSTAIEDELSAIQANMLNVLDYEYKFLPGGLCERILQHISNGDRSLALLDSYSKRLQAVTTKKIRVVADKYLSADRFARVVIRPTDTPAN